MKVIAFHPEYLKYGFSVEAGDRIAIANMDGSASHATVLDEEGCWDRATHWLSSIGGICDVAGFRGYDYLGIRGSFSGTLCPPSPTSRALLQQLGFLCRAFGPRWELNSR